MARRTKNNPHGHPRPRRRPRLKPNVVVRVTSPNRYAGELFPPQLMVLHDTEGQEQLDSYSDLEGLGSFFAQTSTQAASQVAVDGDGYSARFVSDHDAAWHVAGFNRVALGIEQIGFASYRRWKVAERKEAARWLAQWSHEHGIPLRRGAVSGSTVTRSGVVTHKELGIVGGGHVDPGPSYNVKSVIRWAKLFKALRYGGH